MAEIGNPTYVTNSTITFRTTEITRNNGEADNSNVGILDIVAFAHSAGF